MNTREVISKYKEVNFVNLFLVLGLRSFCLEDLAFNVSKKEIKLNTWKYMHNTWNFEGFLIFEIISIMSCIFLYRIAFPTLAS